MKSKAVIQFLKDWREFQHGVIQRTGQVKSVQYDMQRLPHCFTTWRGAEFGDTTAYVRFHPRGEIVNGTVVAPVRDQEDPPGMVIAHLAAPFETTVPDDATQAEIWFHNFYQTSTRCDASDSRFGGNYWFDIDGAPPQPRHNRSHTAGCGNKPGDGERAGTQRSQDECVSVTSGRRPAAGGRLANAAESDSMGKRDRFRRQCLDRYPCLRWR